MSAAPKLKATEKTSLQMTKFIKAPPAKVFAAWTKAELVSQWFCPNRETFKPESEVSFKVGGAYRIKMKQPGVSEGPTVGGKYLEIVPDKKIVFSWMWESTEGCPAGASDMANAPSDTIVTVEFKEKNGGTEVVLTHERLPDEEQVTRHAQGWTGCLENLAWFAEKK